MLYDPEMEGTTSTMAFAQLGPEDLGAWVLSGWV